MTAWQSAFNIDMLNGSLFTLTSENIWMGFYAASDAAEAPTRSSEGPGIGNCQAPESTAVQGLRYSNSVSSSSSFQENLMLGWTQFHLKSYTGHFGRILHSYDIRVFRSAMDMKPTQDFCNLFSNSFKNTLSWEIPIPNRDWTSRDAWRTIV